MLVLETGLLFSGLTLSFVFAALMDQAEGNLPAVGFFSCFLLTVVSLVFFRWKNRKWKLKLDAEGYLNFRARLRAHPKRARWLERMRRALMLVPSLCAGVVLFFLPVASQLFYSGQLVRHFRFSVPVNWIIVKSPGREMAWVFWNDEGAARYGVTPIRFTEGSVSGATFSFSDPNAPYQWPGPIVRSESGEPMDAIKLEFTIGGPALECLEYRNGFREPYPPLEVVCSTRANGRDFNLQARFRGHEEDKKAFYDVLKSATPAN